MLRSSEFGDALEGHHCASFEEYMEAVNGRRAGCYDSIHQLVTVTRNCGNVMR